MPCPYPARMKKVIIDTDPGIDDAAAILLALASPELSVEAITTIYGNGPVGICTDNARRVLNAANRLDIPVYRGVGKPLLRDPNPGWASQVHGADALGDTDFPLPTSGDSLVDHRPAPLEIIDRVMASPGEITLLALGRLTNLALALSIEPRVAGAAAEIILMGGAIGVPGNVSPVATANLYEDPEAAAIVYRCGAALVQVGLDVCNLVAISSRQLERIRAAGTAAGDFLSAATPKLQSYYRSQGLLNDPDEVRYNDVPAVAYAVDASLFQTQDLCLTIETHSEAARGQTVVHPQEPGGPSASVRVCLGVDAPRLTAMFTERLAGCQRDSSPRGN